MFTKKIKNSLSILGMAVGISIVFSVFITGNKVSALTCGELSGADIQACQTRLKACEGLTGSDARFREKCRENVFKEFDNSAGTVTEPSLNADCDPDPNKSNCCEADNLNQDNCTIIDYVVKFINALSAVVGIVVVIMIAVGGIQYTVSGDDPQAVNAAKTRIRNAILALVFYLFAFAFLQYIVPGGLL